MGDVIGNVTIALPNDADFGVTEVIATILREHPAIDIAVLQGTVQLSSPQHSDGFLTALWWGAAANQVMLARAAEYRPQLMGYLLT